MKASLSASACLPGDPVMALEDVAFGYRRGQPLIEGFSAAVKPGRLCCLIGPNAAGKSTLLKLLLGEVSPWRGRVSLAGRLLGSWSAPGRAALLSYVPQRGGTYFAFTVREVVALGRFSLAADVQAVEQALGSCDLQQLAGRVYGELSVGQQQRVMLARAMAQSAGQGRVMLLDEPGSAMDLRHLHGMMRLLKAQAAAGLAVLVVVHDLNLAARYADDVWLMDEGRLVAAGRWEEVLEPQRLSGVYQVELAMSAPPAAGRRGQGDENAARPVFSVMQS